MIKLGVIFGGQSTEHSVSIVSGSSVIKNLDDKKYEIHQIYIDKAGKWYENFDDIKSNGIYKIGEEPIDIKPIENIVEYLKELDCVFPVLHGLYGEDGTIQGMLELLKIPYVGCKVLSSSVSMDKAYTKAILNQAEIPQTKYIYLKKEKNKYIYVDDKFNEKEVLPDDIVELVYNKLRYPIFVKPSNSGSSVGVIKVESATDLIRSIESAFFYDKKVLIEQGIIGREIELAVLGNTKITVSDPGEILAAGTFYSFDSKYQNSESKTVISDKLLDANTKDKLKELAVKVFKAVDGSGLARVDFFVEKETNKIYVNEINTMPGFTEISMYPKLMENIGIKYSELLDNLIELALEK